MKMLLFDYRESEEMFFKEHDFQDIDITFIREPLNEFTVLEDSLLEDVDVVSVFITSNVTENVIKKFKNLRFPIQSVFY
jgi:hypothetical protein